MHGDIIEVRKYPILLIHQLGDNSFFFLLYNYLCPKDTQSMMCKLTCIDTFTPPSIPVNRS